jgi:hypothetical protein
LAQLFRFLKLALGILDAADLHVGSRHKAVPPKISSNSLASSLCLWMSNSLRPAPRCAGASLEARDHCAERSRRSTSAATVRDLDITNAPSGEAGFYPDASSDARTNYTPEEPRTWRGGRTTPCEWAPMHPRARSPREELCSGDVYS